MLIAIDIGQLLQGGAAGGAGDVDGVVEEQLQEEVVVDLLLIAIIISNLYRAPLEEELKGPTRTGVSRFQQVSLSFSNENYSGE